MVETIVPVVHGMRSWILSLIAFTFGSLAAASAVGLALGAALPAGGRPALAAIALFALCEAAAEAGWLRLPIPQLRRQVPERWRARYPLPVTALLYGAGLGLGFATYLPVATLLVVAAGVAALTGPIVGAAVLAGFGLGRGLVLIASTWRVRTAEAAGCRVEQMSLWSKGGSLRRVNGIALLGLAAVLGLSAMTGSARAAVPVALGSSHVSDPSLGPGGVIAYNQTAAGGAQQGMITDGTTTTPLPGNFPDVDGASVVVDTGPAFQIIEYASGKVIRTLKLVGNQPALSGEWLAYRRVLSSGSQLLLYHLTDDSSRVIASTPAGIDLGAPDISYPRVVYHRTSDALSTVRVCRDDTGATAILRHATRFAYANPSVSGNVVVFVRQSLTRMQIVRVSLTTGAQAVLYTVAKRRGRFLWTTAALGWRFAFTVYTPWRSSIYRT